MHICDVGSSLLYLLNTPQLTSAFVSKFLPILNCHLTPPQTLPW